MAREKHTGAHIVTQNVEELEESLQQGLNSLLEKARTITTIPNLPKEDLDRMQKAMADTVDSLADPELCEEVCALLILKETQVLDKIIAQHMGTFAKILHWFTDPLQMAAREQRKEKEIIKIAKAQGIEGLKILKQKIRWEAGKAERPMDFAKLTLLEEKIQTQINQLNTP